MNNLLTHLVILLAGLLAFYFCFNSFQMGTDYIIVLLVGSIVAAVIMPFTGAFRDEFRWDILRKTRRLVSGWALVVTVLVTTAAMFNATSDYSRVWFAYWVLLGVAGLFVSQLVMHGWQIQRKTHSKSLKRVVLAGGGDNGKRVERHILDDPAGDRQLMARFGNDWTGENIFPIEQLADFVESEKVDEVWIVAPWEDKVLLESALNALNESVVDVCIIPDLHQYRLLNKGIVEWRGMPVINLSGTPMTGAEQHIKDVFDRIISFLLIAVLSPLFLLIALLVRLSSPGPVLFRQERHGIGGELIEICKFRTLRDKQELVGEMDQVSRDDQRVTPIGRILRRSSLDELPQLFNVVMGEMSLVGPRPHPVELNKLFKSRIPRYMLRHKVPPGITGWAQVNGFRGLTDTDDKMALRIEHDLWYIQNWSLWLDVKILMQTPLAMFHRNAF